VALRNVQAQGPAVLWQHEVDRAFAAQPAGALGKAFECAAARIRALVPDGANCGPGQQRVGQHVFPALTTGCTERGATSVSPVQAVPPAGQSKPSDSPWTSRTPSLATSERGTGLHRTRHRRLKKRSVDALVRIKTPNAGADSGSRD